jgi:hypothetical protein
MTGADIIAALLIADENVGGLIAAGSIKLGRLPDGIPLPVLLVRTVSSVDNQPLKRGLRGCDGRRGCVRLLDDLRFQSR